MILSHGLATLRPFLFTLSGNLVSVNLRIAALAAGWNSADPLIALVAPGARISATNYVVPALTIDGMFPSGVLLDIADDTSWIFGDGGTGASPRYGNGEGISGSPGGTALRVLVRTTIKNKGRLAGGGGGGSSGGGANTGGDAPMASGSGGNGASLVKNATNGASGASSPGGLYSGSGGPGGGVGLGGDRGTVGLGWVNGGSPTYYSPGYGGAAGKAVEGNSLIDWLATGTRIGTIT